MALESGGLDAQIEQRMDAYRGNPQKLQQRYGANKELLDLLALQKLTSEKKAVAADMQMKMQQQPGTIAQQREQEALNLTKQEMGGTLGELAGRTKGTLDQKQKMQQQNMQRMAQAKPRPVGGLGALMGGTAQPRRPQAAPPQAQGLAAARMAQGPKMMAGGGIVSFAEGKNVSGNSAASVSGYTPTNLRAREGTGSKIKEYLAEYGITNIDEWQRTPKDQKDRILSAVNAKAGLGGGSAAVGSLAAEINDLLLDPLKVLGNVGIAASNTGLGSALGLSDPRDPNKPYQFNTNREKMQAQMSANMFPSGGLELDLGPAQNLPKDPPVDVPSLATLNSRNIPSTDRNAVMPVDTSGGPMGFDMDAGIAAGAKVPVEEPSGVAAPQTSGGVSMDKLMGNMGFNAEDPNAALKRGFAEADAYTGRAEKAAKYDEMLAEMAEFDAANYDPDRERRDRLKSFLMGAAGTTNIGTTFASAGAASMNLANSQRKNRRKRLMDKFNMEKDKMTTDTGLAQSGLNLGSELYSQAQQNQRTALQMAVQMRGQDLTNAQKNADRVLKKIEGDNTQAYRAAMLALEDNKLDLAALKDKNATEAARVTAANNTIFRTLQVREQITAEANALAGVEVAKTELENAELMGLEPDQVEALQKKFDKAAALALVMTEDMMNKFGRGVDKDGNPTGTSLLDAEQFAIQVLGQYGIQPTIDKDSVTSTSYNE